MPIEKAGSSFITASSMEKHKIYMLTVGKTLQWNCVKVATRACIIRIARSRPNLSRLNSLGPNRVDIQSNRSLSSVLLYTHMTAEVCDLFAFIFGLVGSAYGPGYSVLKLNGPITGKVIVLEFLLADFVATCADMLVRAPSDAELLVTILPTCDFDFFCKMNLRNCNLLLRLLALI